MIETIEFQGENYPLFQTNGNAARFCLPFALEVCKGEGYDIGCGKLEWSFPDSIPVDIALPKWGKNNLEAMNLTRGGMDYIFSSHCLEHLNDWVSVLDYWTLRIRKGGTLFLYLPHYSQKYWRPFSNRKHLNIFTPRIIKDYLINSGNYKNIFVSKRDLYNSFMVMAEKI